MLCVGVFLFPMSAHAAQNDRPPVVNANVEGEILRIEATGGVLGIEAIFINEQRFNFRVDGALSVDLLAFRDSETLSVYAVDFDGNVSNVVLITNPHYVGLAVTQGIPVTPAPFTPDGQASVLDNVTSEQEKEFFTFTTPEGNVFFLVVDRQREADNVYFLNAVTERDLLDLAEKSGTDISSSGGIPVTTTPQNPTETPETDDEETTETPPAEKNNGNGTMIFMLVAVAIAGGVGYYVKIVRPKQQGGNTDYEDEDEDEDDIGDEMEFEDDPDTDTPDEDRDDDYYNTDDDEPKVEDDGL
jgi:hypothetical protein